MRPACPALPRKGGYQPPALAPLKGELREAVRGRVPVFYPACPLHVIARPRKGLWQSVLLLRQKALPSLRTSDRRHWCGNPFPFAAVCLLRHFEIFLKFFRAAGNKAARPAVKHSHRGGASARSKAFPLRGKCPAGADEMSPPAPRL